jgi:hypothetical protein
MYLCLINAFPIACGGIYACVVLVEYWMITDTGSVLNFCMHDGK